MTDPSKGINQLEALALLYAGYNDSNSFTFSDYIDTRFENTFDVYSRTALKTLEVNVLGPDVSGIVLDPNAGHQPGLGGAASEWGNSILAVLGMSRPSPTAICRVMVLGDPHTDLLEIPATYGTTDMDKNIIKNYPAFAYAPTSFPLIPGSFIKCKFDKGTYQSGVVTSVDTTMPPFILGGEAYTPLSSSPDFGRATDMGSLTGTESTRPAGDPPDVIIRAQQLGFETWTDPYRLWLFGIRSPNRTANSYDDQLGCVYIDDQEQWQVYVWPGTTDPGNIYLLNPAKASKSGNITATAILKEGQYTDTWKIAKHSGKYYALCQRAGKVAVYRDGNLDKQHDLNPATVEIGPFGINLHASTRKGALVDATVVNWSSAGCQVHAKVAGFEAMMRLAYMQVEKTARKTFTYTLLDQWWDTGA